MRVERIITDSDEFGTAGILDENQLIAAKFLPESWQGRSKQVY